MSASATQAGHNKDIGRSESSQQPQYDLQRHADKQHRKYSVADKHSAVKWQHKGPE